LGKLDASRTASRPPRDAGRHALAEILSQPRCWDDCLRLLEQKGLIPDVTAPYADAREWLFIGCGSSYYIAQSAAACWSAVTGMQARAIPASELVLFPDLVLAGLEKPAAVLISRSGRTSEALQAAEILEQTKAIRTLAVTCTPRQPLEQIATRTLCLLPANEESTVMTRSFTSMLLALQYLAGTIAGNAEVIDGLRQLPARAENLFSELHFAVREFVAARQFADYVFLGQGSLYGLACESALKLTEMSVSYGQSFHTLEFRHGPKSIVAPETLIVFLLSESGYEAECSVLEEVKSLGGTTIAVADRVEQRARRSTDLVVELGLGGAEVARMPAYVCPAQLAGLYTGLKKGLDPDNPRNLSRVVLLDRHDGSPR
jgi:glutamine---fructose-6-phosphate transaminase (isomerizing)